MVKIIILYDNRIIIMSIKSSNQLNVSVIILTMQTGGMVLQCVINLRMYSEEILIFNVK